MLWRNIKSTSGHVRELTHIQWCALVRANQPFISRHHQRLNKAHLLCHKCSNKATYPRMHYNRDLCNDSSPTTLAPGAETTRMAAARQRDGAPQAACSPRLSNDIVHGVSRAVMEFINNPIQLTSSMRSRSCALHAHPPPPTSVAQAPSLPPWTRLRKGASASTRPTPRCDRPTRHEDRARFLNDALGVASETLKQEAINVLDDNMGYLFRMSKRRARSLLAHTWHQQSGPPTPTYWARACRQ